jgi:uncharacterized protein
MFISIRDLQLRQVRFQEEFAPGAIELQSDLRQLTALETSGHAELLEEHVGHREIVPNIRLVGELSTRVEMRCARCLDPIERDIETKFDLLYRPLGSNPADDDASISEAETEIGFYQGEGILLEDVLREQILLALPVKAVCREDCKGLCPQCGANLNAESCNCAAERSDPRWSALQGIKEKLQS